MNHAEPAWQICGACPGALQPMWSGDGLVVRIRPRAGAIALAAARDIAEAAQRCGNGLIDLTRRANLQLRGLSTETLPDLLAVLARHDLVDANADAEAVRNIMVSPLAGADPEEVLDVRPLAHALEADLAADDRLWRLPSKFGFVVDGGGALTLDAERADIRLRAFRRDGQPLVAVFLDRASGQHLVGALLPQRAVDAALSAAHAYLALLPAGSRARMRDIAEADVATIASACATHLERDARPWSQKGVGLGGSASQVGAGDSPFAKRIAIIAAPFGRMEAQQLTALAEQAGRAGATEIRLSPWRTLYLVTRDAKACRSIREWANRNHLLADRNDPLLAVDACPGAPACMSASLPTRDVARDLARHVLAQAHIRNAHVSGCSKGCARSTPADLTLVARGRAFDVIRNGTAADTPAFTIAPDQIAQLPSLLAHHDSRIRERAQHG